jgi:serine/threonine-protein kinase
MGDTATRTGAEPVAGDDATRDVLARALAEFDAIAALPDAEQRAALEALRAEVPEVHERVAALLAADRRAEAREFLGTPAAESLRPEPVVLQSDRTGTHCGAWTLLRPIGEGGMGQVWLAERNDGMYSRRAAVKLLGRGGGGAAAFARFVREGQILARLTHPNVAGLIDAGVQDGERYLVLEYVAGLRIDDWCDERQLAVRDRVRLFLQLCKAVAHAHGNFVVHRDLKPSNVLVTDDGVVKLLDFGVAKLVEGGDVPGEATELTRAGGVGMTPEFAAPEQVLGGPVTAATDVYALALVLYELLTGRRPFARGHGTAAAVLRAVVETEARRASAAVAEDRDAERSRRLAENRSTQPARLADVLRGDLDNILGKALKKAPVERYGTVREFAADLRRWLDDLPVEARSDSISYRTLKFVSRHRYAVGTATVATLAVLVGAAIALWQAHEARLQAARAEREAAKANAVKGFVLDLFNEGDVNNPGGKVARDATVETLLDNGVERVGTRLAKQPEVREELLDTLAILQLQYEAPAKSEALYRQLHSTRAELYGPGDERTLDALVSVSTALRNQTRYEAADAMCAEVIRRLDAAGLAAPRVRGRALKERAYAQYRMASGSDAAAVRYGEEAVRLLGTLPPDDVYQDALYNLGRAYEAVERYPDAAATFARGIRIARRIFGEDASQVHGGRQMRARVLGADGAFVEAERELAAAAAGFMRKVGESHRYYVDAMAEQAEILALWGRWREAEPALRSAYAKKVALRGPESGLAVRTQFAIARLELDSGDPRAALGTLATYFAMPESKRRRESDAIAALLRARALVAAGRASEGVPEIDRARAIVAALEDGGTPRLRRQLALTDSEVRLASGDADAVEQRLRESQQIAGAPSGRADTLRYAAGAIAAELAALRGADNAAHRAASATLAKLRRDPERAAYHEAEARLLSVLSRTGGSRCDSARTALEILERTQKPTSVRLAAARAALDGCAR